MKSLVLRVFVSAIAAIPVVAVGTQGQEGDQPLSQVVEGVPTGATSSEVVALPEGVFSSSPNVARTRLLESVRYRCRSDGRSLSNQEMPTPVVDAVSFFAGVVIPSVEYKDAKLGDILRFVCAARTTPVPDKNRSIGLVYEDVPPESNTNTPQAGAWIDQPLLGDVRISCSLRRINMLEFIQQLSKAANLDVGFTQDGQIVFGRGGKWAVDHEPAYLIQFDE